MSAESVVFPTRLLALAASSFPIDLLQPRGLWLLTHERLRHTPRVRVVLDFLAERLTGLARQRDRQAADEEAGDPDAALAETVGEE